MEVELKYSIDDASKITKIFNDPEVVRMQEGPAADVTCARFIMIRLPGSLPGTGSRSESERKAILTSRR